MNFIHTSNFVMLIKFAANENLYRMPRGIKLKTGVFATEVDIFCLGARGKIVWFHREGVD